MIDRREALHRLGTATLVSSLLSMDADELLDGLRVHGAHAGHVTRKHPTYRFMTLTPHQRQTVAELAELIIPTTDTPGAKDAAIDEFIDIILTEWSTDTDRMAFLVGLLALDARATQEFGATFVAATAAQRTQLLLAMDAELTAARAARQAWRRTSNEPQPPDHRWLFFHQMRSLTVSGYYSSEAGYTKERKASVIPGLYVPCMPVTEG